MADPANTKSKLRGRWTIGEGGFIGEASLHDVLPSDAFYVPAKVELTDVYVHPMRRGLGWGDSVVDAALAYARRYRWDVFLRCVPYGKEPADLALLTAWYRRKGFRQLRRGDKRELILRW